MFEGILFDYGNSSLGNLRQIRDRKKINHFATLETKTYDGQAQNKTFDATRFEHRIDCTSKDRTFDRGNN